MAALTGLMATSMGVNAAESIATSYGQAQSMRARGDFQKSVDDANSRMSDIAASDAIARGDTAARLQIQKVRGVIGSQRAALAAQGVDVNTGSAKDVQVSTAEMGALDAATIKNNAFREAMGYRVEALNYRSRGAFASLSAKSDANLTLLTGGMKAIGYGTQAAYWAKKGD